MSANYTGSCKCGAIKIEMTGEPQVAALCNCLNCRKTTGSMFSTNAVFPKTAFKLVSGEPKVYEQMGGSGKPALVNFCGNCSSTMWTASPQMPDILVIKVGVLDGDAVDRIKPVAETFVSRKPAWLKAVDGTAQFQETYQAPSK